MAKKEFERLNDQDLAANIDRLVELRPQANEYRLLCDHVKAEVLARNVDVFTTPKGAKAQIEKKPGWRWVVEKLKEHLSRSLFAQYCPAKADSKKLNQRLVATPDDKKLAGCRIPSAVKKTLRVLGPGETAGASDDEEEDSED